MDQISEDLNSNWSERLKSDPDIQASVKNRSNLPIMNFKDEIMSNIHESPVVLIRGNTGKSLSETLIFASTNPQFEDRLFIELQVHYMKITSSNLGRTCCVQKLFLTL